MNKLDLLKTSLKMESEGLLKTANRLNEQTLEIVEIVDSCQGKIVFTGVGKSGHVGKKLAATFSSVGIPAIFVHSTEAFHGDFGMIQTQDIVFLLSNSGSTQEVLSMLPTLRKIGCITIAFTSKDQSSLADMCDYTLHYTYEKEADVLGLAPTTSSTTMLALGDSIAVVVSASRQFTKDDFHLFHPGGALGKQLEK
ncbi:SIS domain-containing protein [Carnobacteriaceae bacterium zg-84]|uniref:KpsF/GutQ family sugar-phosphate isomerase n=1 Tax=Granulicatella sp. zg-84 TaxID=2678503 RepID=UPI0013BEB7C5|nr:SIS domain-containing protein [Granulicatella sp. zg-84]NEW66788.1 SIS domain-containing protein [Granulicatella sp. zg-84]QMI85064.1 SIS domain-containing protein [Carnobacteriaceae bacterium zg-84]